VLLFRKKIKKYDNTVLLPAHNLYTTVMGPH